MGFIEMIIGWLFVATRPKLSGRWFYLLRYEKASYKPYLSMLSQWQATILVDGLKISGRAERRSESSYSHPPFVYDHDKRQRAEISGVIRFAIRPKFGWVADLQIDHKEIGRARATTSSQNLARVTATQMDGIFDGDASDSSGRVSWSRNIHRLPDMTFFAKDQASGDR